MPRRWKAAHQAGTDTGLGTFDPACTQATGQNNTRATIQISGGTTTEPTTTTSSPGGGGIAYGYNLKGS